MQVTEIFYSIQGESLYAGLPCVFVRLTGCNLRCSYCDTRYAWYGGCEMDIEEIVHAVSATPCRMVEITGGEPLLQEETPRLISCFLENEWSVLLETNGSWNIDRVDRRCVRIVDIKCPSSGQSGHNDLENLIRLSDRDQVKFVIGCRSDYEFARNILHNQPISPLPPGHILFSPITRNLSPAQLAAWILEDGLPVRLQLQLHKMIWPDRDRGV